MGPKKATGAAAATKEKKAAAVAPAHASYKDMIKEAVLNLKERNGSSRQAIKKYVRANNQVNNISETQFDALFNKALKVGAEKGEFSQPKGPSGPVKLAKKETKTEKKAPPAKKEKAEKKPAPVKKVAPKPAKPAAVKAKKPAAPKKAVAKPKSNTAAKRAPKAKATKKTETPAPAVQDVPTVLKKTKSGRVAKTKAPEKKAPAKKAPTKKATPAKKATPKKAAA